jgi:hypothetical protein
VAKHVADAAEYIRLIDEEVRLFNDLRVVLRG